MGRHRAPTFVAPYTRPLEVRWVRAHHCDQEFISPIAVDIRAYHLMDATGMLRVQPTKVIQLVSGPVSVDNARRRIRRLGVDGDCIAVEGLWTRDISPEVLSQTSS